MLDNIENAAKELIKGLVVEAMLPYLAVIFIALFILGLIIFIMMLTNSSRSSKIKRLEQLLNDFRISEMNNRKHQEFLNNRISDIQQNFNMMLFSKNKD